MEGLLESEYMLEDDFPVVKNRLYIIDGKIQKSDMNGDVSGLKARLNATEIASCDAHARSLEVSSTLDIC